MITLNILIFAVISFVLFKIIASVRFRRTLRRIPSPPGHWLVGNMDILLKNPAPGDLFKVLRECAQKYWPIYKFASPYMVAVGILHPVDFEIVLSQMKHMEKCMIYKFLENWLGEGLLTSTGLKWQQRRKLLTQAFHFNVLRQFLNVFNEETQNVIKQIEAINASNESLKSISVLPIITHLTLQSMSETSLGIKNIEEETIQTYRNNIYKMGGFLIKRIIKPWTRLPFFYSLTQDGKDEKATIHTLHEFTYRVIREREKQMLKEESEKLVSTTYSGRKTMKMLDLLLHEKLYENSIDYEGIREEVDTFMFEGHDTTSAAIVFLLHSLSKYPKIQDEVRKEIFDTLGPEKCPTYLDLQKLPYTERVIKEALRLYPSVPFIARIASEDFISHTGYLIPKGTILYLNIFDLHRDPRIYPDPLKFDPDRFLPEPCSKRHPFAYLPFSAGPRNCIGQKFALMEIKAVVAGVLRKFKLEEDPDTKLDFYSDLVLRVEDDVNIKFIPL